MEAWIDQEAKIVSFHPIEGEKILVVKDEAFWKWIRDLISRGYRLQ